MAQHKSSEFRTAINVAFGLIVAGLLGAFIWDLSASNSQYARSANDAAKEYGNNLHQRVESTCRQPNLPSLTDCIIGIVQTTQEAQRDELDLAAQKSMASSALWMLLLSAVALLLTGVGAWFVWKTLLATQAGVLETRRIGEAQVRAYIGPPEIKARIETSEGSLRFKIDGYLTNSGNSPAIMPSVTCVVWRKKTAVTALKSPLNRDIAAGEVGFHFLQQGRPISDSFADYLAWGGELVCEGVINYYTVFDEVRPKTTTFRVRLSKTDEGDGPFRVRNDSRLDDGRRVIHMRD